MRDFLGMAYAAVRRVLDVEVVLDPASATPEEIPRDEPVIVLSRHCGPGDSVLVAWLLTIEYRLQVRIVLKAILRCEPALDFAGELGCLCFLARGGRARRSDSRSGRVAGRRAGDAPVPRGRELHLAAVARRDRRTPLDRPDSRSQPRVATVPYAAPAHRRCHRCGDRSTECQCPRAHPQRLLPGRAGTALVAAARSTGNCSSAPFWSRPPSFPRPIS